MSAVESEFNIRRGKQKLIFRGKSLIDEESKLASYNVRSGSKIMLIGKAEVADPIEVRKLSFLEDCLLEMQQQMASLKSNLDKSSDIKVRSKIILAFTEKCMKDLEIADTVVLPPADEKLRKRRKDLVNAFHDLINSAEAIQSSLESQAELSK